MTGVASAVLRRVGQITEGEGNKIVVILVGMFIPILVGVTCKVKIHNVGTRMSKQDEIKKERYS